MAKLRTKQRLFLQEYIKTKGNGTQAALRVYDTKDSNTAGMIASREIRKANVKEELEKILNKSRLKIDRLTDRLADIVEEKPIKGFSGSDVLDAVKTGLKLHGVLVDRKSSMSYSMRVNYKDLSEHELKQLRSKKLAETEEILKES
jgi:phage terminase small subunit